MNIITQLKDEKEAILTVSSLRHSLDYNPDTGMFFWKNPIGNSQIEPGTEAGRITSHGYIQIQIKGILYYGHRLAWLHYHGTWPDHTVDHINGNRSDNRISNLRDVPLANNIRNSHRCKHLMTGIRERRNNCRWEVSLKINGVNKYIGTYRSLESAIAARDKAKLEAGVAE